mmetsp:Transcript_13151/g.31907  ORF Transcript_13151/g.31907 Transcript_13151/m.31907 type:complete len:241 (+) Transcript_13151:386-1108(+)
MNLSYGFQISSFALRPTKRLLTLRMLGSICATTFQTRTCCFPKSWLANANRNLEHVARMANPMSRSSILHARSITATTTSIRLGIVTMSATFCRCGASASITSNTLMRTRGPSGWRWLANRAVAVGSVWCQVVWLLLSSISTARICTAWSLQREWGISRISRRRRSAPLSNEGCRSAGFAATFSRKRKQRRCTSLSVGRSVEWSTRFLRKSARMRGRAPMTTMSSYFEESTSQMEVRMRR